MKIARSLLAASFLCASAQLYAGGHAHWGYTGEGAPGHWAGLDPAYVMCGAGRNQSPVDLSGFTEAELPPAAIHYQAGGVSVVNNGHTVQANYAPGSYIEVDGIRFELKQFHFHTPSENTVEGRPFAMEGHLVHADADGNLAVVAVMFEEGAANPAVAAVWEKMPHEAGGKAPLEPAVNAADLLPPDRDYYRFNGSLTTPPCSEGVRWLVMKAPVSVSKKQVEAFAHLMHHPNNRPVQPLNARTVLR